MYLFLSLVLALSIVLGLATAVGLVRTHRPFAFWMAGYLAFILFGTGRPSDQLAGPMLYKLPWAGGVERYVAQGNRSLLSHRDLHEYAWDFIMPNGTEVLAARDGMVLEVEDSLDGVGLKSNYIWIEHADGERSGYAHIARGSAQVRGGQLVKQGQVIARSGMVGQTLFPHLHFYVHKDGRPVPARFEEAGVPIAGRAYVSENSRVAGDE